MVSYHKLTAHMWHVSLEWVNMVTVLQDCMTTLVKPSRPHTTAQLCGHLATQFAENNPNYEMRQFNSRNGSVKAKFDYLYTSGCCRLRNTLLVKLCTSWDNGATAGNSLENCFPEYLTVMFSRCVGCQKDQQIFVLSGHSLILEEPKIAGG